jgi:AcrR family transcriptional regulator
MPRTADPEVQERIMVAARRLFVKGGGERLSMRALAKLARTNTPAVYRRFRDRDAILYALIEEYQRDCFRVLEPCRSLEEMTQAMLKFALSRPREYELFYSKLISKAAGKQPNFEFAKRRAAEWLGGVPDDHDRLVLALTALTHGSAMLVISQAVIPENESIMLAVFSISVRTLLDNAARLRQAPPELLAANDN